MNRTTRIFRLSAFAMIALALLVQGCKETPTEPEVTIEELFTHLNIAMGSTTGGEAVSDARVIPPGFETPWDLSEIRILGPNSDVRDWPLVTTLEIGANRQDDHMNNAYAPLPEDIWPDLEVAGGVRFGNMWGTYPAGGDPNDPVGQHFEWIRRPVETTGTTYPFDEKFLESEPCDDCPFGFFIAGPSRHTPNDPIYQRITNITWYFFGDFTPFTFTGGETPGNPEPPAPAGPPELTEVHLWVESLSGTLGDGSTVTFPNEIGDVELFSINGQPKQIADSAVPQGEITSLSFGIDPTQSWVRAGGVVETLNLADSTIVVQGPWTVGSANPTTVTLTVDIDGSMTWNEADGSWTFTPIIVITVTTR